MSTPLSSTQSKSETRSIVGDFPELSTQLVNKHDASTCPVCRLCAGGDQSCDCDDDDQCTSPSPSSSSSVEENASMLNFQVEINIIPQGQR